MEAPLPKLEANYVNHSQQRIIARPISSGYELKQELAPEIKRNLPSEISEKPRGLNINAPSFVPKLKQAGGGMGKKPDYSGTTYKKSYYNNPYGNNININMKAMGIVNNINSNPIYYGQPYYGNNTYKNSQYQYQPNFYQNSYGYNMTNTTNTQYNNQYNSMRNNNMLEYNKNQNSQPTPLASSDKPQKQTFLKYTNVTFIPKSMRVTSNKTPEDAISGLNKDAPEYTPQNEALKKKEEEIRKQKEKEKEKEKEEKAETKEEKEQNEKENDKNEEKKEEESPNKKPEKEEEKKNRTNDENSNEQKKKSKLAALLESKDDGKKAKPKEKTKQIGNDKSENTQSYKNKKKPKSIVEQKIDQVNTKGKKYREEEERQREEERKRKEEEEKVRREEEKKRKEEERKKREEEERKREEEEERKRKEEEERRKEEEEKRKQMELEEQKRKEEEEKNKVIEKKYFIVFKNRKSEKKEYKYTFEYIMQFKNWKISNEDELLTDTVKQHFKDFEEEEREGGKRKKNEGKINKNRSSAPEFSQQPKTGLVANNETPDNPMEKWARKDMTKEIKAAEEYKQKLEETIKDDPIKRNLREYLNMLTKDNYEQIKQDILGVIRDNVEYQIKFLDVLFQKAVLERAYVALYAKLCKELDKELPQKNAPRAKLLDKCKEIFQIKKNETFDEYIKEKDPQERENKLKKFVLGNVYFITELIKIKILSKKIGPVCINNLFERYESSKADQKLKLINLQAIVIFTDQFGSLVHAQEKKIDSKDAKNFKDSIDKIFQKLEQVKDDQSLPGYIYYSIINLIEKRKNNYQMSKHEEYMIAKSKKEVEQELENQDQITQENINERMKKGLTDYKDFIEEEGGSDKYPWKETTYLYDKKRKDLDDILEGYIEGCGDFIEKQSNIKYAKSYIKELIEYYSSKIHKNEKIKLKNRLINLFERVRDFALETPSIYDVYAYVICIFLENEIMEVEDLEGIIKEKDAIEEDYNIVSSIFKKVYKLYKVENFKRELEHFNYISKNKDIFSWVFNQDENEEEEKNEE